MMHSCSVPSLNRVAAACCTAFALLAAPLALAQSPQRQPTPQAASADGAPTLTLQASAASEVEQDIVRITLAAEFEAASQSKATTDLTAALDDAVKRTKGAQGIEVRTSGYNVWPNTNDKGKIENWRARGEITLESKDFAAASALATQLSDKAAISQISFSLSREARQAAEEKLLKQAADAFRARAQAAATAFGFGAYHVKHLELSGGGSAVPVPRPMAAMAKSSQSDYADVPLEAGKVTVTIAVNGTVDLR